MIKKIFTGLLYAILLLTGIYMLSGCKKTLNELTTYKPIGDTKSDTLLVYNLLVDSSENDYKGYALYVNDSLYLNLGYGVFPDANVPGVPNSISVPAGGATFNIVLTSTQYNVRTAPAKPDLTLLVCQKTITIPAQSGFGHLIFYDSAGKPAISYMPISSADPGAPAPGTFKLRVINFCYDIPPYNNYVDVVNSAGPQYAMQLQLPDSTVVSGDEKIPFGTASAYKQFTYGTEQFMLYNLGEKIYLNNCGPLNDQTGTFNVEPVVNNLVNQPTDYMFPSLYVGYPDYATTMTGNIGSYPFAAGGCYSIFILGNIYAVSLDRMYGQGSLDNYGKIQLVNANPDQQNVQVTIATANGQQQQITSLPFGAVAQPIIVPAGDVTCTFTANGQTIATYSSAVPRLGDYTWYFTEDQNNVPTVFPSNVTIDPLDYQPGGYYSSSSVELNHVPFFLNLSPDAGPVFFTENGTATGGAEVPLQQGLPNEIPYKDLVSTLGSYTELIVDGTYANQTVFGLRLSAGRTDTLASALEATLSNPFGRSPCPGTYTLVAAGKLDATDPAKKLRLIMVQQSNFIYKAQ
jgi:hypothetical protein